MEIVRCIVDGLIYAPKRKSPIDGINHKRFT